MHVTLTPGMSKPRQCPPSCPSSANSLWQPWSWFPSLLSQQFSVSNCTTALEENASLGIGMWLNFALNCPASLGVQKWKSFSVTVPIPSKPMGSWARFVFLDLFPTILCLPRCADRIDHRLGSAIWEIIAQIWFRKKSDYRYLSFSLIVNEHNLCCISRFN